MDFIKQNKPIVIVAMVLLGIFIWWYTGYAQDKSLCEDKVRFNGKTSDGYYCIGAYSFGQCEGYAKRYETYDMAMDACMKARRK